MNIDNKLRQYLGERVKQLRAKEDISQEVLAAILNVTRTSVCNIETGRQGLTAENVVRLCHVFKCTPNDIFPQIDNIDFSIELEEETILKPVKKKVFKITLQNNNPTNQLKDGE